MNPPGSKAKYLEVHQFKIPKRTDGDGMENEGTNLPNDNTHSQVVHQPIFSKKFSAMSVSTSEKAINLIPKKISDKSGTFTISFPKEPKFVPYEPYKAAVNPIIPKHHHKNIKRQSNQSKTNVLLTVKNEQSDNGNDNSVEKDEEINRNTVFDKPKNDVNHLEKPDWETEKEEMRAELSRLKEENNELEHQLKFQTQVNGELKKLLVAAVGEDIETKVQLLTEDKLYLAKKLLNTAKTLSTHQEQIEWLANQCEVWRSKFLASSSLVEDLAKWKAGLCQKLLDYQNVLKLLMEEKTSVRDDLLSAYRNLTVLHRSFNLNPDIENLNKMKELPNSNILDVCISNRHLSDALMIQLLGNNAENEIKNLDPNILQGLTEAEKNAERLMMQPMVSLPLTDPACNAVLMGAALALSSSSPHCSHCSGTVRTI